RGAEALEVGAGTGAAALDRDGIEDAAAGVDGGECREVEETAVGGGKGVGRALEVHGGEVVHLEVGADAVGGEVDVAEDAARAVVGEGEVVGGECSAGLRLEGDGG